MRTYIFIKLKRIPHFKNYFILIWTFVFFLSDVKKLYLSVSFSEIFYILSIYFFKYYFCIVIHNHSDIVVDVCHINKEELTTVPNYISRSYHLQYRIRKHRTKIGLCEKEKKKDLWVWRVNAWSKGVVLHSFHLHYVSYNFVISNF